MKIDINSFNKPVKDFTKEDLEKLEGKLKVEIEDYENDNVKNKNREALAVEIALKDMLKEHITQEDYQANPGLLDLRKKLLKYAVDYSLNTHSGNLSKKAPEHKRGSFFGSFYNDDSESKS